MTEEEIKNFNTYEQLNGHGSLIIHYVYKLRVKRMERQQGTTEEESTLLDILEFQKNKYGKDFNMKNYIKFLSENFKFPEAKLYSGLQKRRAQRKWAKRDFLKKFEENTVNTGN